MCNWFWCRLRTVLSHLHRDQLILHYINHTNTTKTDVTINRITAITRRKNRNTNERNVCDAHDVNQQLSRLSVRVCATHNLIITVVRHLMHSTHHHAVEHNFLVVFHFHCTVAHRTRLTIADRTR